MITWKYGLFTQLNYTSVPDFTIFEHITVTKMNDSRETDIPDIPESKIPLSWP